MTDSPPQDRPRRPGTAVLVVAVIAVLAVLGFLLWDRSPPPTADRAAPGVEESGAPASQAGGEAEMSATTNAAQTGGGSTTPLPVEGDNEVSASLDVAGGETIAPAGKDEPAPPSFDIVRIDRAGMAVIAGRAEPGAEVTVKEGETVIAQVTADAQGEWVALPAAPIESGTRELALVAETPAGGTVESESVVVLSIPEYETTPLPEGDGGALAVLVPKEAIGGSAVMQAPAGEVGIRGPGKLSLDTIEYDDAGNLAIGGRADEGARIVVYMDNRFVGSVEVGPGETWRVIPETPVETGLHSLRVDQVDASGAVVARIETPFSRAAFLPPGDGDALVIVQPGNSLWRIARRSYGRGIQYVQIFQANRDQIADPDLIYPGQIFMLPRVN